MDEKIHSRVHGTDYGHSLNSGAGAAQSAAAISDRMWLRLFLATQGGHNRFGAVVAAHALAAIPVRCRDGGFDVFLCR
jgi:hypothetical protein